MDRNGIRYVGLISDSRSRGLITASDMIRYSDLKTRYFEELSAAIWADPDTVYFGYAG